MNRKELILDFIKWYRHHYIKTDCLVDASTVVDHQKTTIDDYLEMLEAVEDLDGTGEDTTRVIYFKEHNLECSCRIGYVVCENCRNYYKNIKDEYKV